MLANIIQSFRNQKGINLIASLWGYYSSWCIPFSLCLLSTGWLASFKHISSAESPRGRWHLISHDCQSPKLNISVINWIIYIITFIITAFNLYHKKGTGQSQAQTFLTSAFWFMYDPYRWRSKITIWVPCIKLSSRSQAI